MHYRSRVERHPSVRKVTSDFFARRELKRFEALRGIDLEVRAGTVLGIIGRNGAGKTTLLRAIAGIIPPAEGRITVRGEVSTLLSLGVGFKKQLTGRDNIILGGLAAGGHRDRLREILPEIVAFAELEEFIDHPMSAYSSGMAGRLAFAVATHLNADVLLIDEALATGDIAFKEKCLAKMRELCTQDRTVIVVSHGLQTIEDLANDCLWLHKGEVMERGEPGAVTEKYRTFVRAKRSSTALEE